MSWGTRLWVVFVMVAWFAIGWLARGYLRDPEAALVQQARSLIQAEYYGGATQPAPRELTYAAIRGMLYTVDQRGVFLPPQLAAKGREDRLGVFAGIGLTGDMQDDGFHVTQVNPGDPAAQIGLQPGDIIVAIDGQRLPWGTRYQEVAAMIRGTPGSVVGLDVLRDREPRHVEAARKDVSAQVTIRSEGSIGYLSLRDFNSPAAESMRLGLGKLLDQGARGVVWDLRGNGGGSLNELLQTLDYILGDEVAFYSESADGRLKPYYTTSGDFAEQIPLVVLIDNDTYSAPEVAAAAVSELQRGILVGQTTHGKGTINTVFALGDGSTMRLTVARWLSALHGVSYEGIGVSPDVFITDDPATSADEVLQWAVAYLAGKN